MTKNTERKTGGEVTPRMLRLAANIEHMGRMLNVGQREIGEAAGYSKGMALRWMHATSTPDAHQAADLASYFKVPVDLLVNSDLTGLSPDELDEIRGVAGIIKDIGYKETRRRLLMMEPAAGNVGRAVVIQDDAPSRPGRQKRKA